MAEVTRAECPTSVVSSVHDCRREGSKNMLAHHLHTFNSLRRITGK